MAAQKNKEINKGNFTFKPMNIGPLESQRQGCKNLSPQNQYES